ncbi:MULTISPECIES: PsiF family protein [unclassified Caballeronia]|uniref:PsiF family protein n=1 Tax=unclassified Caballeronia TaxID=2646786 RepID=UPI002862D76F|nr:MULTISPECIES: PsiF family protein [unclassified Caballeronia]MDR5750663.1 PsiF family protein [Caballeronia sp. LZ024]MDR5842304.1 PsiF family protein [Caballeronia sp. LZ031]
MNIRSNRFIQSSVAVAVLGMALAAPGAFAANSQQSKMTECNKQATDKKGDERKAFMKSCLSADAPAAASTPMTQQEKMTACNKSATGKKGDERKAYMKDCLSTKG